LVLRGHEPELAMRPTNVSGRVLAVVFAVFGLCASYTAQGSTIFFSALLSPEAPGATGSGTVQLTFDDVANTLLVEATWAGLSAPTTVAHIHCCIAAPGTVGVAVTPGTLPGFPVGLTSGSYTSPLLDLDDPSTYTVGFVNNFAGGNVANADDVLLAALAAGTAYFNIHSSVFASGEIREFLQPGALPVPEPATLALMVVGLLLIARLRRRRA
jgi:hypothetical protein